MNLIRCSRLKKLIIINFKFDNIGNVKFNNKYDKLKKLSVKYRKKSKEARNFQRKLVLKKKKKTYKSYARCRCRHVSKGRRVSIASCMQVLKRPKRNLRILLHVRQTRLLIMLMSNTLQFFSFYQYIFFFLYDLHLIYKLYYILATIYN